MASETPVASPSPRYQGEDLHRGERLKSFRETMLAYFLIMPALVVTLIFGIYPVISGLWESLKQGRPIPNEYVGLEQYLRGVGSLVYVLLLVLAAIFCLMAFQAWQRAREEHQKNPADPLWWYLIPGFFAGFGGFAFVALWLTGGYRYQLSLGSIEFSVLWAAAALIVIGVGGYQFLSRITKGNAGNYVLNTLMVMTLTIFAVLLVRYMYEEMKNDVEQAREVASQILTTEVGTASPLEPLDGAQYVGTSFAEEEVPVQVEINDVVYEASLSPQAYAQVEADRLSQAAITFTNNQRVQVVIPLQRGLGLEPVLLETEGNLVLERDASQIGGGAPTLEVPIQVDGDNIRAPYDIFLTSEVGESVVSNSGYTVPIEEPFLASVAIGFLLLAIYVVGKIRERTGQSESRRGQNAHAWLGLSRLGAWLIVFGLVAYVITHVHFYRQAAFGIRELSIEDFQVAYEFVNDEAPPATMRPATLAQRLLFFPQVISIAAGAMLIGMAFIIWLEAQKKETGFGLGGNILFATMLMVGGWLCISELPSTIMAAGTDAHVARDAMIRTAMYSVGTVPFQLAIGMTLAYFLFYEVKFGKGLFRLIYFMPYITPQVATATIFTVIFSLSATGLANQFLDTIGITPQLWLQESDGVVQVAYEELFGGDGDHVPAIFEGPSLALLTVILFNIWVYAGYNAVIFLAGLGAIPGELYEAARVDGAGRWAAFRHITFPLLSPVTFFLSILAIIGTFKAFGSVYVIKNPYNDYADTFTILIFDSLFRENNRGYASSLAFVLFGVIMILTLIQTRLSRGRVFYG